jgi:hypothetical protein
MSFGKVRAISIFACLLLIPAAFSAAQSDIKLPTRSKTANSAPPSAAAATAAAATAAPAGLPVLTPGPLLFECPSPSIQGSAFATANLRGGIPPYTYSSTGLADSTLNLDPKTGVISGSTSPKGILGVQITVQDSSNPVLSQTQNCNLTVTPNPGALTFDCPGPSPLGADMNATGNLKGGISPYTYTSTA